MNVAPHEDGVALVGFIHPEDMQYTSLTALELREAAHTLNLIADALLEALNESN